MENYTSYWDFLKKTPKNLWSIVVIWAFALAIMIPAALEPAEFFDPSWSKYGIIAFMGIIMIMGYLRPYTIYIKFKK